MPLSEDEQRILRQMEEDLQRDPRFGRSIQTGTSVTRRGLAVAGFATVVGLVLTIALLSVSPFLSFVTFAASVACAVVAERHVRSLGEAGLNHLSDSMRSRFPQQRERSDD
jgi:hypothetical protein